VEQVLGLYREKYFDLNVRHFHEKLREEHQVELSYTWVKLPCKEPGWYRGDGNAGCIAKRRPRRTLPGMLLHIDGSRHRWFQDERWHDLIVILDDASSEIYYAQLVEEESTVTVMRTERSDPAFSAAHLPSLVLTVASLPWGIAACTLLLRYRNLYALGLVHGILGLCIAISVPDVVTHRMMVRLGYLQYHH